MPKVPSLVTILTTLSISFVLGGLAMGVLSSKHSVVHKDILIENRDQYIVVSFNKRVDSPHLGKMPNGVIYIDCPAGHHFDVLNQDTDELPRAYCAPNSPPSSTTESDTSASTSGD